MDTIIFFGEGDCYSVNVRNYCRHQSLTEDYLEKGVGIRIRRWVDIFFTNGPPLRVKREHFDDFRAKYEREVILNNPIQQFDGQLTEREKAELGTAKEEMG